MSILLSPLPKFYQEQQSRGNNAKRNCLFLSILAVIVFQNPLQLEPNSKQTYL